MSTLKNVYGKGKSNGSYRAKLMIRSTLVMIGLIILTFICLFPIYILIVNATRTHFDITTGGGISLQPSRALFENIRNAQEFFGMNFLRGFLNSFIITASATVFTIFFSCLTAYGLCVYDFRLKDVSYTFILAIMMVPTQVTSVGFVQFMYQLKWIDSYWPLIIPAIAAPAVVFFMCSNMKSTFPFDIVEAARIDGCGEFRTFLTIGLPLLKPAIAVQAIFAFIANWNNYYLPSLILISRDTDNDIRTIPLMLVQIQTNDQAYDAGADYAAVAVTIVPLIVIYSIISRFIIEGVTLGGVKE